MATRPGPSRKVCRTSPTAGSRSFPASRMWWASWTINGPRKWRFSRRTTGCCGRGWGCFTPPFWRLVGLQLVQGDTDPVVAAAQAEEVGGINGVADAAHRAVGEHRLEQAG